MNKHYLALTIALLGMVLMCGCGGGFKDDNSNASEYQKVIFGPDSIAQHFSAGLETSRTIIGK